MNRESKNDLYEELLYNYLKKMLKANETINLTRVTDYEQAKMLHIEDSLSVLQELNNAPEGLYGDLGSGCGFPGVALALASGRKTILIDSVKKKMNVVSEILNELNIGEQIQTQGIRIEELACKEPNTFSVLTARALSSLPSLLELASPLLEEGGILIALKSHVEDEELKHALTIENKTGMKLVSNREYYLNDGETYRSVYVFKKVKEPSLSLPRKVGLAQKRPLK